MRARDRRGSAVVCVSAAQVRINHSTFHAGLHRLELLKSGPQGAPPARNRRAGPTMTKSTSPLFPSPSTMKGAKSLDVYTYFEFPATSCRINHHAPAVERGSYRVRPYTEALYSPVLPGHHRRPLGRCTYSCRRGIKYTSENVLHPASFISRTLNISSTPENNLSKAEPNRGRTRVSRVLGGIVKGIEL